MKALALIMDAANILSSQTANGPLRDPKAPILYSRYTFLYHCLPHPVYRKRSPNHCNIYPVILGCVQCTMYMKEILLKNCQVMTTVLIPVIGGKYGQTITVGYKLKNPTKQ